MCPRRPCEQSSARDCGYVAAPSTTIAIAERATHTSRRRWSCRNLAVRSHRLPETTGFGRTDRGGRLQRFPAGILQSVFPYVAVSAKVLSDTFGVCMSRAERYRSRAADLHSLADRQNHSRAADEWRTMAELYLRLASFVEVSQQPAIQLKAQDSLRDYQKRHRRQLEEI